MSNLTMSGGSLQSSTPTTSSSQNRLMSQSQATGTIQQEVTASTCDSSKSVPNTPTKSEDKRIAETHNQQQQQPQNIDFMSVSLNDNDR